MIPRPISSPAPFSTTFKAAAYDGAIAYVDSCIGRIVSALEQDGTLDRTLLVVVSDHGESLGEHGERAYN